MARNDLIKFIRDGKTFFSSEEPIVRDSMSSSIMGFKGKITDVIVTDTEGRKRKCKKIVMEELEILKLAGHYLLWLYPQTEILIFKK